MMFGFRIYTPLSIREAESMVAAINLVIERINNEHADEIGSVGTISAEDEPPDIDGIKRLLQGLKATHRPLLQRLEACETTIMINEPGDLEGEPVLVSVLRHFLSQTGSCVIDWGGLTIGGEEIEPGEDAVKNLDEFPNADQLVTSLMQTSPAFTDEAEVPEDASPNAKLQEQVIDLLTRAQVDLDFGADVRRAIDRASPAARTLMRLMVAGGTPSDVELARSLQVPGEKLPGVRSEVEALLDGFRE